MEEYQDLIGSALDQVGRWTDRLIRFTQERPVVVLGVAAALLGALGGVVVASVVPRPRPETPIERVARLPRRVLEARPEMPRPFAEARRGPSRLGAMVALAPLALRLLANPVVRDLLFRQFMRRRR